MGVFDSLYIGKSGLNAAQIQIEVTGQNITNVNSDYYTRQRVVQSAAVPLHSVPGDIGRGTTIETIERVFDEYTYTRLKTASTNLEYTDYKQQILQEIAQTFPDLDDTGLINDLENYFNAWNNFASYPYESSQKTNLLAVTQTLTSRINDTANSLEKIHASVNDQLQLAINEINEIGQQIATINRQLQHLESNESVRANDLRDKRDQLELTMAKLVNITTFKSELYSDHSGETAILTDQGKNYNLNIGGITIVDGVTFHPLSVDSGKNKNDFSAVYYELKDETRVDMSNKISGGKLGAILDLRGRYSDGAGNMTDGIITEFRQNLDSFAKTLIEQTNNIYATAAQDKMISSEISGMQANTTLQNLSSHINNGNFQVKIYDATGNIVAQKTININNATTINDSTRGNSIIEDFNSNTDDNGDNNLNNDVDDYFQAVFTYDSTTGLGNFSFLPKYPDGQYKIAIEDNGTNFAGVFGISKFFEGTGAADIKIESSLKKDSSKILGGKSPIDGDNSMANAMVNLQNLDLNFDIKNSTKSDTISGFYRYLTSDIASRTESNNNLHATNTSLYESVYSEFQSTSGVNMDEELSNLIRFQSSYGAAAKIITTTEQMLETLLGIKQ